MFVISISYYLEVPVDKISDIDVNVIISKGVQHSFWHLDPTHDAEKFHKGKKWDVHIRSEIIEGFIVGVRQGSICKEAVGLFIFLW